MRIFDEKPKAGSKSKGRTPKLGDRHARGLSLGAVHAGRGPATSSPTRDLKVALIARLSAPVARAPGSVMARAECERELRVVDPGWRLADSPRARLFGVEAPNAEPPDIEVLGDPFKIDEEIREQRSDLDSSRNVPERDQDEAARAARSEAERAEAEHQQDEAESSPVPERERQAAALATLSMRLAAAASPADIKVSDGDRLDASLRKIENQGDDMGTGRPPTAQRQPESGVAHMASPFSGEVPAAATDAGRPITPGATGDGLPIAKQDSAAVAKADAVRGDSDKMPAMPPLTAGKTDDSAPGGAKVDTPPTLAPVGKLTPLEMKMPGLGKPTAVGPDGAGGKDAKDDPKALPVVGGKIKVGAGDDVGSTDVPVAAETVAVPGGGGGSGGEVAAWKGRVGGATGKVKGKDVPDSDMYVTQIKVTPLDANQIRAARMKKLDEEGKKAITPAKDPPENKVAIPEDPTHSASKLVDELCGKKLDLGGVSTTMPDLKETPHHHVPVIGSRILADKNGFEYVELPPVEGEKGAKPEIIYKPGGYPPLETDKKRRAAWEELQKKLAKAPPSKKRVPGKGVTVKEENAPPPIAVPEFAKVDVGDVLARLLAEPDTYAAEAFDKARKSFYSGVLDEVPGNTIGQALAKAEAPAFAAELQRVADAAGIKKEDLDKKVEARRKELIDKQGKNQKDLSTAHEQAKKDIQTGGKEFMDAVASIRARIDDEGERRAAAAKGGVDLAEMRKKRDSMYAAIDDKVAKWVVIYDGNGKRFKKGLDKAAGEQMQAYQVAAKQDEWELMKDCGEDKVKVAAAQKIYDESTGYWLNDRRKEIGKVVTAAKKAIDKTVESYQTSLRTAGKTANQQIREWYDKSIGYERGWWSRFLDWVLGWVAQSKKESAAWESARAAETSEALNKDMVFLAKVRLSQGEEMDEAAIEANKSLGEEQKAILKEYYKKGGKDAVQALAAGVATRIRLQRQPEIVKALEKEVTECNDIDVLVAVGNKQTPGFSSDYMNRVVKVRQGCEYTWGTDEAKIFEALANLTPIQSRAIELAYEKRYGENMRKRLESELNDWVSTSHDWDKAQALLAGDQATVAAVELNDAMEGTFLGTGWGTDEDKIFSVLRGKTADEIEAIKKAYKAKYGKDLGEHLKGELGSGPGQTAHDVEEAGLLMDGKVEEAQAVEMDRAMRGTFLGTGWGTDRKAMEKVYERIKSDVEAQGRREGWTAKMIRDEIALRNAGLDAAYEKRYGKDWADKKKPGESALRAAFRDEMQGEDLNLIVGMADQNWKKVDAARIQIEHTSFWYADDKVIRDAMSAQYKRDIADAKIDGYLDADRQLKVDREFDEAHNRMEPPPITAEERAKGIISRLEYLDKWLDKKKVFEARKAARKAVDVAAEESARKKAPENLKALAAEFDTSYTNIDPNTGLQLSFTDVVRLDTSGADNDAVNAMLEKGYLTPAEEVQYAVQGGGTDEDKLKEVFKGKTKAEIQAMANEWAAAHPADPGDTRSNLQRFKDRIREELSGRDEADIMEMVEYGEPQDLKEEIAKMRRRRAFEGRSTNSGASDELALIDWQIAEMESQLKQMDAIEASRPKPDPKSDPNLEKYEKELGAWGDKWEEKNTTIERVREIANESIEIHRNAVDEFTDAVSTVVGVVIGVVLTVVGALLVPFTGGGSAALVTMMWIALAGAVVGTAANMIVKAVLKGDAYGWEEIGTDLALGAIEAAVAVLTVGIGDKLLKAGMLAKLAAKGAFAQRMAGFLAHQAENLVQIVPGALAGNIMNDQNYRDGNAIWNILSGTVHQAGVGMAHANVMHVAMSPIRKGSERLGAALAKRFGKPGAVKAGPPKVDLLELRSKPQEVKELWKAYKADNPDASFGQFKQELDAAILERSNKAFEEHKLQRAMRKELLEHVPVAQRKALAKAPIEVLSEADFKALTGSDKAQAVTMFRRGKPTVVIKAGADLTHLGEEGLHILQSHDPATKKLIKALDEIKLRNWEKLPVDEQLGLYRKKLALEIDANEKLAASLEKRMNEPNASPDLARQADRTRKSLTELQKRLAEVESLKPHDIAEMAADPSKKPQYLREKPRLFNKSDDTTTTAPPAPGSVAQRKAKAAKQGAAPREDAREVIEKQILADPEMQQKQLDILKAKPQAELTPGEIKLRDSLEAALAQPPPPAATKSPHRAMIEQELQGMTSNRPNFEGGKVKANDQPLPAERMSTKLKDGETAHAVGSPWMEVRTKRVGNKYETRADIYRRVEIRDGQGRVLRTVDQVLLRKSGNRWGIHGTAAKEAGASLEKQKSLALTEQDYRTHPEFGDEAWKTRVKRLAHQKEGQESGFDELLAVFDNATKPTKADLHIVEVKEGGELPGLGKFGAVGKGLERNLVRLEKLLQDPEYLAKLAEDGIGPDHVKAIRAAIAEGRMKIEVRVGPEMALPDSLKPDAPAGGRTTVMDKLERQANAWRRLRMLEHQVLQRTPPGGEAVAKADLARIRELRAELTRAFAQGKTKKAERLIDEIHGATSKRGAISRRYGIDLGDEKVLASTKPRRIEDPSATTTSPTASGSKPPKSGGGGEGEGGAAVVPAAKPKPAPDAAASELTGKPPRAGDLDPTAAERVRTVGPTGNTLGWGGFDISVSLAWAKRQFRPFEIQQMKRIGRRLTKISDLRPDNARWSALSDAARKDALRQATAAVMDVFKIPESRRPRIEFYNGPAHEYGSAAWNFDTLAGGRLRPQTRRGVLRINLNASIGDAVGTVVHEGRHYYQSYEAYKHSIGRKAHPLAQTWRANLPGISGPAAYERAYMTHLTPAGVLVYTLDAFGQRIPNPRYYTQPIERDAESFGRRTIDLLPLRWPS